ncbi:hypothetical protein BS50DRAFT_211374 [Corynespora cassiicola Philippines]|uniref:Uncharacterized protein n=1 Tax=Corynespora cassiicola Philippines TaxID=1448308 RepID=A0A2T2N422_CORCC|nr:hypothetical protein BS50DRAFT_211374 [Corynespora cassiicola Philippines]
MNGWTEKAFEMLAKRCSSPGVYIASHALRLPFIQPVECVAAPCSFRTGALSSSQAGQFSGARPSHFVTRHEAYLCFGSRPGPRTCHAGTSAGATDLLTPHKDPASHPVSCEARAWRIAIFQVRQLCSLHYISTGLFHTHRPCLPIIVNTRRVKKKMP